MAASTTCNEATDTTILDDKYGYTLQTTATTQTADASCDKTAADIFGCAAICGNTYSSLDHTNFPDFNCAYDTANKDCQVCQTAISNTTPLDMTKMTVCDDCSPIAKLTTPPAIYEF